MTEQQFNDHEYRYNNVNIQTYIDAKLGDQLLFCGQSYRVLVSNGSPSTKFIKVSVTYPSGSKAKTLYIKHLIYCYYNRCSSIPPDTKVINLNEDLFDNRIENLRLIKNIFTEDDINDLSFRYRYIDDNTIKILENAQLGDKVPLYDRNYVVALDRSRLSIRIWYNDRDGKQSSIRLPLKVVIYQYYNKGVEIPDGYYIYNLDGDKFNNRIENLRLVTFNVSEEQFNDWNYRYMYINDDNIKDIENCKTGDRIPFGTKMYSVTNKGQREYDLITVTVTDKNDETRSNKREITIRSIVYGYYNKCTDRLVGDDKVHFINGDKSDTTIDNMRVVDNVMKDIDFNNWNFRYQFINNTNIYDIMYARIGDRIPFCDRHFTVGVSSDGRLILYIKTDINKSANMTLHRIVYEYYNKIILKDKDIIHHIDCNKLNNHIYNLRLVTPSEHARIHGDDMSSIKIMNNKTKRLYNSMKEASYYEEMSIDMVKCICDGYDDRTDLQYFHDYMEDVFGNAYEFEKSHNITQEFSIENIEYYEKIKSDDGTEYLFPPLPPIREEDY